MHPHFTSFIPHRIDFLAEREKRQLINIHRAAEALKKGTLDKKNLNIPAFERFCSRSPLSTEEVLQRCQSDAVFLNAVAQHVAILSSRQGSKDESFLMDVLRGVLSPSGVDVKNLPNNDRRALKSSAEIIDKKIRKERRILKEDCHKSFDGEISFGEASPFRYKKGFIFAKVCIGSGGHQDNVYSELVDLCQWVESIYNPATADANRLLFAFVIDTDAETFKKVRKIQRKYKHIPNIVIKNHMGFQRFCIRASQIARKTTHPSLLQNRIQKKFESCSLKDVLTI